jgi:hypothetical protein
MDGGETWTLRKLNKKPFESFEMWCWVRMEKIGLTDCVENEKSIKRMQGRKEYQAYNNTK